MLHVERPTPRAHESLISTVSDCHDWNASYDADQEIDASSFRLTFKGTEVLTEYFLLQAGTHYYCTVYLYK